MPTADTNRGVYKLSTELTTEVYDLLAGVRSVQLGSEKYV